MLLDIILAQWQRPVASSEALDLLHWAMCAVTYRHIAMAINTATFLGVFVDCCLLACCSGASARPSKRAATEVHFDVIVDFVIDHNCS